MPSSGPPCPQGSRPTEVMTTPEAILTPSSFSHGPRKAERLSSPKLAKFWFVAFRAAALRRSLHRRRGTPKFEGCSRASRTAPLDFIPQERQPAACCDGAPSGNRRQTERVGDGRQPNSTITSWVMNTGLGSRDIGDNVRSQEIRWGVLRPNCPARSCVDSWMPTPS